MLVGTVSGSWRAHVGMSSVCADQSQLEPLTAPVLAQTNIFLFTHLSSEILEQDFLWEIDEVECLYIYSLS